MATARTSTPIVRATDSISPLMLSHHLLNLAEDAHRAGLPRSATRLLRLAHSVCNEGPHG